MPSSAELAPQNSIGTTTATGLEKAIIKLSGGLIDIEGKIDNILYGEFSLSEEELKTASLKKKLKDRGIISILDVIVSVDLCNILNYALQQLPAGKAFNPNDPPPTDFLGKKKWVLQNKAYIIQTYIDSYYTSYGDAKNANSKLGLQSLIKEITDAFGEVLDPNSDNGLNDPQLLQEFPEISVFNNFMENSLGVFNQYTDLRNIPNQDLQKIIQYVDKIRGICIAIQGLNSAAAVVGIANTFLSGKIQEEFDKINKIIDPQRITPFLKSIIESGRSILQITRLISGYINFGRMIIRICTLLVKIFKAILKFLTFLGVPNVYTTLGISTTQSLVAGKQVQSTGIDKSLERLKQISRFLGDMINFVDKITIGIQEVIGRINLLLTNLQNCSNVDTQLIKDLEDLRNSLQQENDILKSFKTTYENNKNTKNNTFANFTIQIIEEETTDIALDIKRRRGIALDSNGNLAVESTPTFASDDTIITNEVKQLLVSKGFVKSSYNDLNSDEINTINEALNYLEDPNISIEDLEVNNFDEGLDSPDNENEESGLGLNAFMNKLSGGKKLRQRMRKTMAQQARTLASDLKSTDPNGTYTKTMVAKQNSSANKLEIDNIKDQITEWKKEMAGATLALGPIAAAVVIKDRNDKIKTAEAKIKDLERQS